MSSSCPRACPRNRAHANGDRKADFEIGLAGVTALNWSPTCSWAALTQAKEEFWHVQYGIGVLGWASMSRDKGYKLEEHRPRSKLRL
jgi:hypothetical protein